VRPVFPLVVVAVAVERRSGGFTRTSARKSSSDLNVVTDLDTLAAPNESEYSLVHVASFVALS
jgi:hypothetical protein